MGIPFTDPKPGIAKTTAYRGGGMGWCEQQRQLWIAETLRVFGFINREHLERKFGISPSQAAKDFRSFMQINPDAMTYDKSAKRYIAKATGGAS